MVVLTLRHVPGVPPVVLAFKHVETRVLLLQGCVALFEGVEPGEDIAEDLVGVRDAMLLWL
jgi:hypothetical protein